MEKDRGKLTFYLVRHAQSTGNTHMNLDAQSDVISDRGKIEVNLLGMHLSSIKLDHVYASDYERARYTAEGIVRHSKVLTNVQVQQDKRLREVDFGIYEQTSYEKAFKYLVTLKEPPLEWYFPEGESFIQAGERILKFAEEICDKLLTDQPDVNHSPNVLAVSHSGAIMGFMNVLHQSDHELIGWDPKELKFMRNASYMKFEIKRKPETTGDSKSALEFSLAEKFYAKHLACISAGTGAHNVNPVMKFAKSNDSGQKYQGCVQQ